MRSILVGRRWLQRLPRRSKIEGQKRADWLSYVDQVILRPGAVMLPIWLLCSLELLLVRLDSAWSDDLRQVVVRRSLGDGPR